MPSTEATVITATSLWATWDSSWASTPSSSSLSSSLSSRPWVAHSTATLLLRPVANALGIEVGAMAICGLGMLASAQSRSTTACSRAASRESSGLTSRAPAGGSALLCGQEDEAGRVAATAAVAVGVNVEQVEQAHDEPDEDQAQQEHRRAHARDKP